MSLHGDVRVNGYLIGTWTATRISNTEEQPPAPDALSVYTWWYQDTETRALADGTLVHRYGDGAAVLASKVLLAATPTPGAAT
jgi:hypothetical protein